MSTNDGHPRGHKTSKWTGLSHTKWWPQCSEYTMDISTAHRLFYWSSYFNRFSFHLRGKVIYRKKHRVHWGLFYFQRLLWYAKILHQFYVHILSYTNPWFLYREKLIRSSWCIPMIHNLHINIYDQIIQRWNSVFICEKLWLSIVIVWERINIKTIETFEDIKTPIQIFSWIRSLLFECDFI